MTRKLLSGSALSEPAVAPTDESHRAAFNAAFRELGLNWRWTVVTYSKLAHISGERDRIRVYLETEQSQLLETYDADFLIDAIHAAKARCHKTLFTEKSKPAGAGWP